MRPGSVVFIIFNRPRETARVFEEIRRARPRRLLVIGDGARANRPGEDKIVREVREIVQRVDWDCEVQSNFSEVNLGCKRRVASGLKWAFGLVEDAIVLEDDCLPHPDFFKYAQEILEKEKGDPKIGLITGTNLHTTHSPKEVSYFYSRYASVWGWATWSSVFAGYDENLTDWPEFRRSTRFQELFPRFKQRLYMRRLFDSLYRGEIDTWDYQLSYHLFKSGRSNIVPANNLISNIGFGAGATHTVDANAKVADLATAGLSWPLRSPDVTVPDRTFDGLLEKKYQRIPRRDWLKIILKGELTV